MLVRIQPDAPEFLSSLKTKWCHRCQIPATGQEDSMSKNPYMDSYLKRKRYEKKAYLIGLKGGKCEKCGYSKCMGALVFHHRNPATKEMDLSTKTLQARKMEVLLEELKKCDLLCANCHAETHSNMGSSSSGLGPRPFKAETAGSNPAELTMLLSV